MLDPVPSCLSLQSARTHTHKRARSSSMLTGRQCFHIALCQSVHGNCFPMRFCCMSAGHLFEDAEALETDVGLCTHSLTHSRTHSVAHTHHHVGLCARRCRLLFELDRTSQHQSRRHRYPSLAASVPCCPSVRSVHSALQCPDGSVARRSHFFARLGRIQDKTALPPRYPSVRTVSSACEQVACLSRGPFWMPAGTTRRSRASPNPNGKAPAGSSSRPAPVPLPCSFHHFPQCAQSMSQRAASSCVGRNAPSK